VCGPLLDSEDVLAEGVDLPDVSPGDLLAFPTCGAYGFNHGLQGFCLHPNAAEVVWDGHQLHLVRERSDTARITDGQYSLPLRSTPGAPVGNV
jgi:diaminopimelate decarboxylase